MENTGKFLKDMRRMQGVSQTQMARRLSKKVTTIRAQEAASMCSTRIIDQWATALDVEVRLEIIPKSA